MNKNSIHYLTVDTIRDTIWKEKYLQNIETWFFQVSSKWAVHVYQNYGSGWQKKFHLIS